MGEALRVRSLDPDPSGTADPHVGRARRIANIPTNGAANHAKPVRTKRREGTFSKRAVKKSHAFTANIPRTWLAHFKT
jgi:hypothetical protein